MPSPGTVSYAFGPFRLEPAERRLLLGDEPVALAPKVFDTLVLLVEADGRLVPKDTLIQHLWPDTIVEEVNLARNISLLRKALGESEMPAYIETVPKSGYRFIAPITRTDGPPAADAEPAPKPPWRRAQSALILAAALAVIAVVATLWRSDASPGAIGAPAAQPASAAPAPRYVRATFDGNVVESVLSPDGTQVASVLGGQPMRLMARDTSTGSTVELARGEFLYHPKWSPDGSSVAVALLPENSRTGYLAVIPRLGGEPLKLTRGWASWAPDGTRFAKLYPQKGLEILGLDGAVQKKVLFSGYTWSIDVEWSRSIDRLLLWTESDRHHTILWSAAPDGSQVKQIYAPAAQLLGATWSPDGSALYVLRPAAESADLVRRALSGPPDEPEEVLIRGLTAARGLSLSADGSRLLFRRVTAVANLQRASLDESRYGQGRGITQLTRGASRMLSPSLAPDGRRVAFVRAETNGGVIHTAGIDFDAPAEALTPTSLNADSPAWSPDGSRIAFAASGPETDELWIIGVHDRSLRRVSTGHAITRSVDSVAWAPDGRIAYQTPDHRNYYLIDPDTGTEQRLGSTDDGWMFKPRFSPDGSLVAVYWNRPADGGPALWIIDLKSNAESFIARGIVPLGWAEGNRAVYGFRSPLGDPEIIRVERGARTQTVIARFPSGVVETGTVSRDGREIVCSIREDIADAWIIENFDGQPRRGRSPRH